MISHETLYALANSLGGLAILTVVAYHFVAVNAKYVSRDAPANGM
jgi:Oligosaccaryltransferase